MKLLEIVGPMTPAEFEGWLCVPRGSIGPAEVINCWVFDNDEDAYVAATSKAAQRHLERSAHYLPNYRTSNGISLVLELEKQGLDMLHEHQNTIYAFGITEKSAEAAGLKAWRLSSAHNNGTMEPWVFRVRNSDPSFFDEDEE